MTDPRKQRFTPYIRSLADSLGLKDWSVKVCEYPPGASDKHPEASVWLAYGRKRAEVMLSEGFLDMEPERQRVALVHEMIHPHFDPAWEIAEEAMPETVRPAFVRMMEYGIDGLAEAIASLFPLPPTDDSSPEPTP